MQYILYHGNCLDGFMSAAIAYLKFGENAEYIAVYHQKPLPEILNNSVVYILDFSYPREIILDLQKRMKEVIILDHHLTAKEQLLGISGTLFDLTKSGAILTWQYFFPESEVPLIVQMIQDRDLWQWKLPNTKPLTEALYNNYEMKHPQEWQYLFNNDDEVNKLIEIGKIIVKVSEKQVERQLNNLYWGKLPRRNDLVPIINTNHLISETSQAMYLQFPESKYVVTWYQVKDEIRVSLRTNKEEVNVAYIAKEYGGGGHPKASGFTISSQLWFNTVISE